MVAPAHFDLGATTASPYSLSPWCPDDLSEELPNLLRVLRGDFFCLPFGPQDDGQPHGETANARWRAIEEGDSALTLRLDDAATGATVERRITLEPGHSAIYFENTVTGLTGDWSYGTHPVLDCSQAAEGTIRVSVSPFRWASVYPGRFSLPEDNESQALKPGALFEQLESVETISGPLTDLSSYPARSGNDDLVMMVNEPATAEQPFAWSAVVFEDYLWFALKNPSDYPATLFWLSNAGRRAAPWNGEHVGRLGVEEVCSHFHDNVAISREDRLSALGIPTSRNFDGTPVRLPTLHAVAPVPANFGKVVSIVPSGPRKVTITSDSQQTLETPVHWEHVT